MTDWSEESHGVRHNRGSDGPAVGRSRDSAVSSVGLMLVLGAFLLLVAPIALVTIKTVGGLQVTNGGGAQGRVALAVAGANGVTALVVIMGVVLARPAVIGVRGGTKSASGSLAAGLGVLVGVGIVGGGCYDSIVAFTMRLVPSGLVSAGLAPNTGGIPGGFRASVFVEGVAVIFLGAAAALISLKALATE